MTHTKFDDNDELDSFFDSCLEKDGSCDIMIDDLLVTGTPPHISDEESSSGSNVNKEHEDNSKDSTTSTKKSQISLSSQLGSQNDKISETPRKRKKRGRPKGSSTTSKPSRKKQKPSQQQQPQQPSQQQPQQQKPTINPRSNTTQKPQQKQPQPPTQNVLQSQNFPINANPHQVQFSLKARDLNSAIEENRKMFLEENVKLIRLMKMNIEKLQVYDNLDLMIRFRSNIANLLKGLDEMPPLPVKVNTTFMNQDFGRTSNSGITTHQQFLPTGAPGNSIFVQKPNTRNLESQSNNKQSAVLTEY